jgi:hypothetical protein
MLIFFLRNTYSYLAVHQCYAKHSVGNAELEVWGMCMCVHAVCTGNDTFAACR